MPVQNSCLRNRINFWLAIALGAALTTSACGGGGNPPINFPPAPISIQLAAKTLTAMQDGTPASLAVTVMRPAGNTNSVSLSVISLPPGVTVQFTSPGTGNAGKIDFNALSAAAGSYQLTVGATDGVTSSSSDLTLVVAIVSVVQNSVNMNAGINGRLQEFMSTSFQPADWDFNFFTQNPNAITPLNNLNSQHIRLQPLDGATPQKDANNWDFTKLDAIVNPVLTVADKSPEFQIAVAPDFMRKADGTFNDPTYNEFAAYCVNLVKYYNTATGFVDGGGHPHVHSTPPAPVTPITWWGIFNEPNINKLSALEYTKMYNVVVPAMQAVNTGVALKFVAVELADFGSEPQTFLPPFVSGVTAQVDVLATHYYSSCNQAQSDAALFDEIAQTFVPHVNFIYTALKAPSANPALANLPVWVMENNVNADYDKGNGVSACNGTRFVTDSRGTSAFFAAWRPYVFSQLGQAGNQSLYHWDFDADTQYGEVNFGTGKLYLSYWVDYYLARYFPSPPGSTILKVNTSEATTVETLATHNDDGSVVIMLANRAVHAPSDNNGNGDPRTIILDVGALTAFVSAQQLTIDASTDIVSGPVPQDVPPASRMTVTLNGYGVTFLRLKP